jgi:c-di-GMP phosphodiesterase
MLSRIVEMFTGNRARHPREPIVGGAAALQRQNEDFMRLNQVAPLLKPVNGAAVAAVPAGNADQAPSQQTHSIVCREAVLGTDQRVKAYSFILRHKVNERVRDSSTNIRQLYDDVLLRNLQGMEIQRLLGHRLAFITVSASSLDLPVLEQLPREGAVYVVGPNEQLAANPAEKLARLAHLKALGYRLGLHGAGIERPDMAPFLALADFMFVDVAEHDIPTIRTQLGAAAKGMTSKMFVAMNIKTREEFHVCSKLPFSMYQGVFVTSRESWNTPKMDASRLKIVQLLNKMRSEAEVDELSALIRQDPALSFKILRYINSPGIGLLQKATTIEQAMMVMGRQQLYRWLTLLMFTSGDSHGLDRALLENALVRARLCELLAENALASDERDELFVAGVFSLLDILLGSPMAAVLKQVCLPPMVNKVLLHREGKYAPYLNLAIACEQHDAENIAALSEAIGMAAKQVNSLHIEALVWAQLAGE